MKKNNIFTSFSNNRSYLVMGCVHLLDTAHLLRPWKQTGHHHPHCLLHTESQTLLDFYHSDDWKPALQRRDSSKRTVAQSNVETVKYLELVVSTVSRGCRVSLQRFKISQGALTSVAELVGWSTKQKVTSSIPGQAYIWVVGLAPYLGTYKRQLIDVSLSHPCFCPFLSSSLPNSLKVNK